MAAGILRLTFLSLMGFGALLTASDAQAGFEWMPPAPPALAENAPAMPAMPAIAVEELVTDPEMADAPGPRRQKPQLQPDAAMSAPVSVPAVNPVAVDPASVPAAVDSYPEIVGFGTDMPLALALRQIVPAQYAFSFDSAVDPGARIDWNGGKPWNVVLQDALAPHGLGAQISAAAVRIVPGVVDSAPALPAADPVPVSIDSVVDAAPVPLVAEQPAPEPAPVREIYIRRDTGAQEVIDRTPDHNAAINAPVSLLDAQPAAGSPALPPPQRAENQDRSLWARLGMTPDKTARPGTVSHPPEMPAPLLTGPMPPPADDLHVQPHAQPVSLIDRDRSESKTSLLESAPRRGVMDPYDVRFWQAEKGDSLKNVLATWSDSAGVALYWVAPEDYTLPEAVRLHGNYTDAVTRVLSSYSDATDARPQGRLHPNLPTGPSVLIIEPSRHP